MRQSAQRWPWILAAAGGALLLFRPSSTPGAAVYAGRYSFGEPDDIQKGLSRDPNRLLPSFARKVEVLFQRLRARGLDPMLNEAYRTPERARRLAQAGTGIADSMHSYGAAVDIVDRRLYWNAPAFFRALGEEAEALGLTWGGRFSRVDMPHVQAVPVKAQNAIRASANPEAIAAEYLRAA